MGCSSSREALGGVVPPGPAPAPAERRQSLRSRSLTALTSLGMCRGRNDGVHAYTRLPSEEPVRGSATANGPAAAEGAEDAAVEEEAPATPEVVSAGVVDGAAPAATASWTAAWQPEPEPSPPPVHAAAPDLDAAILPGLRQIVVGSSPSHPALLYPEHDCPAVLPQPETTVVEACDVVDMGTPAARDIPEVTGIVRARVDELHEQMEKKKRDKAADDDAAVEDDYDSSVTTPKQLSAAVDVNVITTPRSRAARTGKAVVLYFTSLRGVRRTFEDGRAVRAILRCYRVRVDERDVSMHAAFRSELRDLLGAAGFEGGPLLPRVFVGGGSGVVELGGADDVRALHEAGELARALAGCDEAARLACAACGDARFAPCETCHGSCKVFVDDEGCRFAGFFRRCPDCNENGLIRCPVCCY